MSARCSRVVASAPCSPDSTTPTLASTSRSRPSTSKPSMWNGLSRAARSLSATAIAADTSVMSGSSTANSSPPRRATVSTSRNTAVSRGPTWVSSRSQQWGPKVSLISLNRSRSISSRAAVVPSRRAALLLIDLDRFKEINDTFGHHCGDLLLTQVGPRLTAALREVDTVARLGGDEFAVLLPDITDVSAAIGVADKLRAALESPFHIEGFDVEGFDVEGLDLDVEASVGVVLSGEHGADATTLQQRADIAMYVAKSQNLGVFAYDPAVDGHSPAKLALLGDLRRALDRNELVLHYQPKVSISTGDVIGAEALVRWQHPDRGLVPPDDFIPLAEHTGLIGPLTRYVLDSALGQIRAWADAGRPLTVAVNLSARNLLDERLPAMVAELLTVHGVPAALLELEVTESALMTEQGRAQRLLEKLARLGVAISVDDFGAGYTSLGQLKDLPVRELKVDRSFVTTMTQDRSNALIVHSVVDLGHNLGLTIVAEGVE